jgi:hypothetical protein
VNRASTNASFELVEEKRAEMSFFLVRLSASPADELAFRSYFSAFASASMSVLYALDAARKRIDPQFDSWYRPRREQLTGHDPIARYVLARRGESVHLGEPRVRSMRIRRGDDGKPAYEFFFSLDPHRPEPVAVDVLSACEHTHNAVWDVVEDVRKAFPRAARDYLLDATTLAAEGLTVEDAEERLGFPRGWSFVDGYSSQQRLDALRAARPPVVAHPAFAYTLDRFDSARRASDQPPW